MPGALELLPGAQPLACFARAFRSRADRLAPPRLSKLSSGAGRLRTCEGRPRARPCRLKAHSAWDRARLGEAVPAYEPARARCALRGEKARKSTCAALEKELTTAYFREENEGKTAVVSCSCEPNVRKVWNCAKVFTYGHVWSRMVKYGHILSEKRLLA